MSYSKYDLIDCVSLSHQLYFSFCYNLLNSVKL